MDQTQTLQKLVYASYLFAHLFFTLHRIMSDQYVGLRKNCCTKIFFQNFKPGLRNVLLDLIVLLDDDV